MSTFCSCKLHLSFRPISQENSPFVSYAPTNCRYFSCNLLNSYETDSYSNSSFFRCWTCIIICLNDSRCLCVCVVLCSFPPSFLYCDSFFHKFIFIECAYLLFRLKSQHVGTSLDGSSTGGSNATCLILHLLLLAFRFQLTLYYGFAICLRGT